MHVNSKFQDPRSMTNPNPTVQSQQHTPRQTHHNTYEWSNHQIKSPPAFSLTSITMSQSYFPGESSSSAGEGSSRDLNSPPEPSASSASASHPPEYMTVGNGETSASAHALMASLAQDSGYGGSIMDGSLDASSEWRETLMQDRPTPSHTPVMGSQHSEACEFLSCQRK